MNSSIPPFRRLLGAKIDSGITVVGLAVIIFALAIVSIIEIIGQGLSAIFSRKPKN